MNEQTKITIHVEDMHTCGQVITQVLHVQSADFSLSSDPLPTISNWVETGELQPYVESKRKITFTGEYTKLEINGLEMKDHKIVCIGCGADMLFPERKE